MTIRNGDAGISNNICKQQLQERAEEVFARERKGESGPTVKNMQAKSGQLTMGQRLRGRPAPRADADGEDEDRGAVSQPWLSDPHPGDKIWPYLLEEVAVTRANQVCAAAVTYISLACGFAYWVAVVPRGTCGAASSGRPCVRG